MTDNILPCYYALSSINYKNGFVTTCAQQSDHLHTLTKTILPSEFLNNDNFKKLRLDLMEGCWPRRQDKYGIHRGCDLCEDAEQEGTNSMRMDYPANDTFYNHTTGETSFEGLKHIELRFSNSCNMACLHCSKVFSSGWVSKLKYYMPDQEDKDHNLGQLLGTIHRATPDEDTDIGLTISEVEQIIIDLNRYFPNIAKVDFAGGEVLHQKQFFPCLKLLAKHPNAKNIDLLFHSNFNANFDPIELSDLLSAFGHTEINMSIDSGKNIYSYFREGSWDILVDNIGKFRSINNFTKLNVVCTTSAYQIMDIQNVFESFLTLDIDYIKSSIVYDPPYLNPAIMNLEFKDYVIEDIKKTYDIITKEKEKRENNRKDYEHYRSYFPGSQEWHDIRGAGEAIENIEQYITKHQSVYKDYEAFLVYIRKTDKLWQQNFNEHLVNYKYIDNKIVRV
jgi:MoaA/NifB/PqqE/SkfB family radical SAM enzyme